MFHAIYFGTLNLIDSVYIKYWDRETVWWTLRLPWTNYKTAGHIKVCKTPRTLCGVFCLLVVVWYLCVCFVTLCCHFAFLCSGFVTLCGRFEALCRGFVSLWWFTAAGLSSVQCSGCCSGASLITVAYSQNGTWRRRMLLPIQKLGSIKPNWMRECAHLYGNPAYEHFGDRGATQMVRWWSEARL